MTRMGRGRVGSGSCLSWLKSPASPAAITGGPAVTDTRNARVTQARPVVTLSKTRQKFPPPILPISSGVKP